jgi:hypothetical protein
MSYFSKFPLVVHTVDNYQSGQIVPDILRRAKIVSQITDNFAFYDQYDVKDGETPEIVADLFYNDSTLHWIILHSNEVIDPRFDWPLSSYNLKKYVEGKYNNTNDIHHYENNDGIVVNGNVEIFSNAGFGEFAVNDVVLNQSGVGTGYIVAKSNSNSITVVVTNGGFRTGQNIKVSGNTIANADITSTVVINGTPVTNYLHEETLNEEKRRVKILKPEVVSEIISTFENVIKR